MEAAFRRPFEVLFGCLHAALRLTELRFGPKIKVSEAPPNKTKQLLILILVLAARLLAGLLIRIYKTGLLARTVLFFDKSFVRCPQKPPRRLLTSVIDPASLDLRSIDLRNRPSQPQTDHTLQNTSVASVPFLSLASAIVMQQGQAAEAANTSGNLLHIILGHQAPRNNHQ